MFAGLVRFYWEVIFILDWLTQVEIIYMEVNFFKANNENTRKNVIYVQSY